MNSDSQKVWEVMNDLEMVTSKIVSAREIIDTAAESIQKHDYDKAETLAMAAYEFLGYYLEEFDEKFKLAWNETVKKKKSESHWEELYHKLYNRFKRFARYTDQELDEMCDSKEKEEDDGMRPWGHSDMEYLIANKKQPQYQYTATGEEWDIDDVLKEREYYEPTQAPLSCDKDDPSPECKGAWNSFWEENYYPEESNQYTEEELNAMCDAAEKADKVKKWVLPVEECKDVDTDKTDYFITFPNDLLEVAKLKEGDEVNWIDNGDGSFKIVKVTKPL